MRFAPESLHGANNGLNIARELMEQVKKEFPWISYGDLWTLAGVAAVQVSRRYHPAARICPPNAFYHPARKWPDQRSHGALAVLMASRRT